MRRLLIILTGIYRQTTLGQFVIITDKDRFVNVRESTIIKSEVIDNLTNRQILFCLKTESEW